MMTFDVAGAFYDVRSTEWPVAHVNMLAMGPESVYSATVALALSLVVPLRTFTVTGEFVRSIDGDVRGAIVNLTDDVTGASAHLTASIQ